MTYPPPQQPPVPIVAPPKRGLSTGAVVAIVAGTVVVLMCAICMFTGLLSSLLGQGSSGDPGPDGNGGLGAAPPNTPAGHTIRFEVTSPSGATTATVINWSTLEDSALDQNQPLPWSKDVTLETRTGLVGVNASVTGGRVACKLYVDGQLVDEGESDGVVNCSDTVR